MPGKDCQYGSCFYAEESVTVWKFSIALQKKKKRKNEKEEEEKTDKENRRVFQITPGEND